jgi:hypothetical protein
MESSSEARGVNRPFSHWTQSLRERFTRRLLEHRLMEVAARLPYEPESRCTYQHLLEEHMRLACADKARASAKPGA